MAQQKSSVFKVHVYLQVAAFSFCGLELCTYCNSDVAVHLGVKMADTLSFTAKVDMVDF